MSGGSNRGIVRNGRWLTPLGSERCDIRDALERIITDGPNDDDEQAALDALVDFWWNSALDRPSRDRAEQRLVELLS